MCYIMFMVEDEDDSPLELTHDVSDKGSVADLDLVPNALAAALDELHTHLQAKCHAVPARGGQHTVVLVPALADMLAHEAMGHPCDSDIVLGGVVTANPLGQPVVSVLVTMVDIAHSWRGQEVLMPVYADDEGTPACATVLIDRRLLSGFMHSRETAERLGHAPIGNGQADSTTEFMFGITLAYEISDGKIGHAVRDTTVSGSAIKVLQSVDAVSDDMHWDAKGYCGKKQIMVVAMGGPALRTRAHLGAQ